MTVQLNHTIVHARDARAAAAFFSEMFGLGPPEPFGPFLGVETANGVTLDFLETDQAVEPQHYAFLVSEQEFDEIYARIRARELPHWADPMRSEPDRVNHHDGGRGVYFADPDGHFLEAITRPYGSGT